MFVKLLYSGGEWPGWLGSPHCNNFIYTYAALLPFGLRERGIAPHSLLSPLPSLPNGEMLRELGGGSSGARHWVNQRLHLHQQHRCCCSGALQAGGSRLALSPSHLPGWGGASPVTLGVCYANVQGGHAGRTRSADRMRSRPCWLSRQVWAP